MTDNEWKKVVDRFKNLERKFLTLRSTQRMLIENDQNDPSDDISSDAVVIDVFHIVGHSQEVVDICINAQYYNQLLEMSFSQSNTYEQAKKFLDKKVVIENSIITRKPFTF